MTTKKTLLSLCFYIALAGTVFAQATIISVEVNRSQTGDAAVTYVETIFDVEVSDLDIDGASISATSGVLNSASQALSLDDGSYQFRETNGSFAAIATDYPNDATYTVTTTGNDADVVVIAGPNALYANKLPDAPLFTISGVTGGWTGDTFTFDPTGVVSFTVSMNSYAASEPAGHFGYGLNVESAGSSLGEVGGGPFADAAPYTAPVFTFTNGLAGDANDMDDTTYGFADGDSFFLDGNFSNILDFDGSTFEVFIVASNTSFNLVADSNFSAVPEPGTFGIFAGLIGLGIAGFSRRRNPVR